MNKIFIVVQYAIKWLFQKFDQVTIQKGIMYALIAILILFILSKISTTLLWIVVTAGVVFAAYKLYQKYIIPMADENDKNSIE